MNNIQIILPFNYRALRLIRNTLIIVALHPIKNILAALSLYISTVYQSFRTGLKGYYVTLSCIQFKLCDAQRQHFNFVLSEHKVLITSRTSEK